MQKLRRDMGMSAEKEAQTSFANDNMSQRSEMSDLSSVNVTNYAGTFKKFIPKKVPIQVEQNI
jgi:hypothetical protein